MDIDKVINDIKIIHSESCAKDSRTEKHNYIQDKVRDLAIKYGCKGICESNQDYISYTNGKLVNGKIDTCWKKGGSRVLAFEVDSSPRSKSILKLLNSSAKYKIWLCYSQKTKRVLDLVKLLDKKNEILLILIT